MLDAIVRNWYFILLIPAIAFGTSYVITHRIQDVYAAKCQILLRSQETYDYQSQLSRGLGLNSRFGGYEYTAGQMKIIKSTTILDEVLDSLELNVRYYIIGRLKTTELFKHMPFKVTFNKSAKRLYGKDFRFSILDEDSYRLQYEMDGISKDKTFRFGQLVADDGLYLKVFKRNRINAQNVENFTGAEYQFKVQSDNSLLNKLKASIDVTNVDYTSIIEVVLRDEIPDRAVAVLDRISKSYIQTTVQRQEDINNNTLFYIDKQLEEVTVIINTIEDELETYKEEKEILSLTREEQSHFDQLSKLETEEQIQKQQMEAMAELRDYLLQSDNSETYFPPSIILQNADAQINIRIQELYELRKRYASMLSGGTKENPLIDAVMASINDLKQDLLVYLDNQEQAIKVYLQNFDVRRASIEEKIKNIPKSQRDILNIQRRLDVNEQLYQYLLSRRAETVIAKAGLLPETKLIERPRSTGVVYPDKDQMNLTWLLIGFGIAVGIVLIKELFFRKIQNVNELSSFTDIPILGGIPEKPGLPLNFKLDQATPKSDVIQAFRAIRTSLQYMEGGEGCRKFLVTSILPGEGKTFISTNIASILALADTRVLIADFDMHKPRLAKAMDLPNEQGLSTYLSGNTDIESIIQDTHLDNLKAITSGPIPPNPSELILKKELIQLMEWCDGQFDYFILDTPPISLITDGITLMKNVDLRLFVLNSKSTNKGGIDYIERLLEDNNLDRAALIMNREKRAMLAKYYGAYNYSGYYYQYSERYGY